MTLSSSKKAFTLIELLIVITVIGILSVLLFRTLGDMISANGRVQEETSITQQLISIQTTLNSISEHYPILDLKHYKEYQNSSTESWSIGNQGFTDKIFLKNKQETAVTLTLSGWNLLYNSGWVEVPLNNPETTLLSGAQFQVIPSYFYSGSIYDQLNTEQINQPGFWILGDLTYKSHNNRPSHAIYHLQHFINLQLEKF